jgi:hypothetical protein
VSGGWRPVAAQPTAGGDLREFDGTSQPHLRMALSRRPA